MAATEQISVMGYTGPPEPARWTADWEDKRACDALVSSGYYYLDESTGRLVLRRPSPDPAAESACLAVIRATAAAVANDGLRTPRPDGLVLDACDQSTDLAARLRLIGDPASLISSFQTPFATTTVYGRTPSELSASADKNGDFAAFHTSFLDSEAASVSDAADQADSGFFHTVTAAQHSSMSPPSTPVLTHRPAGAPPTSPTLIPVPTPRRACRLADPVCLRFCQSTPTRAKRLSTDG